MVLVVLDPHDASRKGAFTGKVVETGIKWVGEGEDKPMAFIKFEEGPDVTYFTTDQDGRPVFDEENAGYIKTSQALGLFANVAKFFGLQTQIDVEAPGVFQTVPSLVGKEATFWEKKKKPKIKDGGEIEENNFATFILAGIDGKLIDDKMAKKYNLVKPEADSEEEDKKPESKPAAKQEVKKEVSKPASSGIPEDIKESWLTVLLEILDKDGKPNPLNEAGILKAVNSKLPDDDHRKAMHKVRKQVLAELVKEKTLVIDEAAKYSIA